MEVLQKVKIKKVDKEEIKFFLVSGDMPYNWGATESTYGSIVGIPWNFVYKDTKEIDLTELRVFGDQVVNWDSKAGKQLLKSLIFTEAEQKFAIARELYMTDNFRRFFTPINFIFNSLLARSLVCHMNNNPKFMSQARFVRGAAKVLVTFLCYLNYCVFRDMLQKYYDSRVDIRASELDTEYYDAALCYYAKLLQRGKSYRKLMGDEGANYFTEEGDEKRPLWHFLFIARSVPYFTRLDALNDRRNEHYEVE